MLEETKYIQPQNGQEYPMFVMNRDGFTLLAMGFSGDKALRFKLDYMAIVDGRTLQAVEDWAETDYIVGCVAVYCGPVRLIDNIVYKHAD